MNSNHPAKSVALVFPHQLFENTEWIKQCDTIYVVEETLFFHQYLFHKQKIAFHRASMKYYENYLQQSYKNVYYIDSQNPLCDIRLLIQNIGQQGVEKLHYIDPTDNWLEKRIESTSQKQGLVPQNMQTRCL
jgi:deoxyribodipyrimidine photolyase-related protein